MARLVVEGFPDDLMRVFKVKAAQEGTSVKAIIIDLAIGWAKEGAKTVHEASLDIFKGKNTTSLIAPLEIPSSKRKKGKK